MYEETDIEEFAPWLVILITLFGGWMRVLLIASKGMWLDETFSVWVANQDSLADMVQWIVAIDQHPPLYYAILHYWIAYFGDAPYYVRLLSALLGAGTIPLIYLIGKRMSGVVMGLVAAVILAFSPFHIHYAQETRMYTLLTFNAAVAIYALVRLLTDARTRQPIGRQFREYVQAWRTAEAVEPAVGKAFSYDDNRHRQSGWRARLATTLQRLPIRMIETDLAWVIFIVFSAATMLTHNTAVFFPLATNLFVLGLIVFRRVKKTETSTSFRPPSVGNWVKAQIAIFLLWGPWLFAFIGQARGVYEQFWISQPSWGSVIDTLKSFLNDSTLDSSNQMQIIWMIYITVLCLGLFYFRKRLAQFLFLVALFAVPFLGELLVSFYRPIFLERTLIWITIPLFLFLAAGIVQLRFRFLILMGIGVLSTINLFFAADYYRFLQKEDWSTPAGYVALYAEEGDLVLFNSNFVVIPFDYYFKSFEVQYSIQVEKRGVPADLFDQGILEPIMTEQDVPALTSLLQEYNRVWLVYSHDSYTDPEGLVPQTLASQMALVQERGFYGGRVQLYESR